jgi:adenine-specific DNA methylase
MTKSFIEVQFPVSKISKESYKERKAVAGQTLTGLGKWWGRKPLILVRATILGLLLPASDNPERDREIFLKILTMDDEGMLLRKDKNLTIKELYQLATLKQRTRYFTAESNERNPKLRPTITSEEREGLQKEVFLTLGYDDRMAYCRRPEQVVGPSPEAWDEINTHLGTNAFSLTELVEQLGKKQFSHRPRVGDAFCGGGSIPFEAARMGCDAYGSDLNPVANLLTWAAINLVGGGEEVQKQITEAQKKVFDAVDKQITQWGIEYNEQGWRADAYLYCVEAKSPATGYWVPLAPSWVISEKYRVCAKLEPDHNNKRYNIRIIEGADDETFKNAQNGTVQGSEMVCPEDGDRFPISTIRGDKKVNGETVSGLRQWGNEDVVPRPDDVFQERLYCIRYVETIVDDRDREITIRHFVEPNANDLVREQKVLNLLKERFGKWQKEGYIPSMKIPSGVETDRLFRERGWTHWHHLFNPRQLLLNGLLISKLIQDENRQFLILINGRLCNNNSRLARWKVSQGGGIGGVVDTFSNMALNTMFNYGIRTLTTSLSQAFDLTKNSLAINTVTEIIPQDARVISYFSDYWITDPPYADAVNYHEIADFFIAWYEKHLPKLFPSWYAESKAALAVKGNDQTFRESMVDCYSNFTRNMPDNGAQVVMFTHQDSAVWADLALILWASGLQVTAAWTIQTETEAAGIKKGNYVQGTVIMILRKQSSEETAFLSDIQADVEFEVKEQLQKMLDLDDKEDPNFSDTDYQLAAYAAALRVLTSYKKIQDIDVHYELMKERTSGEKNEIQKIIDSAVAVACDYLVPSGFDPNIWRVLTPEERFFVKGLEIQSHGEYRNGVFQELARGFGIRQYGHMLNSGKANETRLMTPTEFGTKGLHDEGFGQTLLRNILFAIRETKKEDSPMVGRNWLHTELPDYWNIKQRIVLILQYISRIASEIDDWSDEVQAAKLLAGYIENDHV